MRASRGFVAACAVACALALVHVPLARGAAPARSKAPRAAVPAVEAAALAKHPDFSGTWILDLVKSDFGKLPGKPKSRIDVIAHRDPVLRQTLLLVLPTGPDTTSYAYRTDSTESVNKVGKQPIWARVWWAGDTLRLESRTRFGPVEAMLSDRWLLAADGKTLAMVRRVKSPMGGGEQRLVFIRR